MINQSEVVPPTVDSVDATVKAAKNQAAIAQAKSEILNKLRKVSDPDFDKREKIADKLAKSLGFDENWILDLLARKKDEFLGKIAYYLSYTELTLDDVRFIRDTLQSNLSEQESLKVKRSETLKKLLLESFSADEIDTLIFDLSQEAVAQLTRGMTTNGKIDEFMRIFLVGPEQLKILLKYIERKNPMQFANHYQLLKEAHLTYLDL